MATTVRIQIRRDTSENWAAKNPVLAQGEIAADMSLHRIKVGNGTSAFNALPWINGDVYNGIENILKIISGASGGSLLDPVETASELSAKYPNPAAGDMAYVKDQKAYYRWDGAKWTKMTMPESGMSASAVENLIDDRIGAFGAFGMGYTVTEFNAYSKPTKITFEDGVTATLTWNGGTQLNKITASTGDVMTMTYDGDGRITGRTVTRAKA